MKTFRPAERLAAGIVSRRRRNELRRFEQKRGGDSSQEWGTRYLTTDSGLRFKGVLLGRVP